MTPSRFAVLLLATAAFALPAAAAELSIETPLAAAGSAFQIPVVFSPEGEGVNAVEGSITVPDGVVIDRIDTSGSAFAVFASGPSYDLSSHSITFTAGAPNGISSDAVALLFVIEGRASAPGTYAFEPAGVSAYRNDGEGTPVSVSYRRTALSVGEKGSVAVDALPAAAPSPLVAEVGKDASLFEGRSFAAFYGGASGGSVLYYEVREGWWRLPSRADRYYVLKDQSRGTTIRVTAVSEGGGRVTTAIPPQHPWGERAQLAAALLAALLLAWLLYTRLRRSTL